MDWKKIAPWNWFRKEQEQEGGAVTPSQSADPFVALRNEIDGVFRRFGGDSAFEPLWPGLRAFEEGPALLRPGVDISEGKKAYTVRVDVPGVEKGDVTLEVEDDTLLIRGEKRQEKEESEEGYHCVERSYGRFQRVLSLPEDSDPGGIAAKFRNGVLKVTIPKRQVPKKEGRVIEIEHA